LPVNEPSLVWIILALALAIAFLLWLLLRSRGTGNSRDVGDLTKQIAEEAAVEARAAALRAFQQQQKDLQIEQSTKRREAAAKAKLSKEKRIGALEPWRGTFVAFVRRLAEPFFAEWDLSESQLDDWATERASIYIARKPYVLEIIQSVHADAKLGAERLAMRSDKSPREVARQKAKSVSRGLERNSECPYCAVTLDDRAHLDHIQPVQRGGPSEFWNMVYACIPCNHAKGNRSLEEFVETPYAKRKSLSLATLQQRLKDLDKVV
jgi:hypothetical protein